MYAALVGNIFFIIGTNSNYLCCHNSVKGNAMHIMNAKTGISVELMICTKIKLKR